MSNKSTLLRLIACIAAIVILLAVGYGAIRFAISFIGIGQTDSQRDPQFAEATEVPPSGPEESESEYVHEDRSAQWDTSVQTPVTQDAEELARLEAAGAETVFEN